MMMWYSGTTISILAQQTFFQPVADTEGGGQVGHPTSQLCRCKSVESNAEKRDFKNT